MRLILIFMIAILTGVASAQSASEVYKTKCQACHGPDGKAETPTGKTLAIPSFQSPAVQKMSDADLVAITQKGKNKMPAYTGKLTDDQIKDLVKYVRTLGNQ